MPSRLPTPCAHPGCPHLTFGTSRCAYHQVSQRPPQRDTRPSSSKRGYGAEWQRIRLRVLAEEPFCRVCGLKAKIVDHIDGNAANVARSNLQAMCQRCHNRKTNRENGGGWQGKYH